MQQSVASCKNVDTEDGTDQLPGWECLTATSHEDQPILSEGDFKEKDLLDVAKILDNTAIRQEQRTADDPGSKRKQDTEGDGDDPDLGQLPFDRAGFEMSIIICNSDSCKIGEQSEEDNEVNLNGFVDDDH